MTAVVIVIVVLQKRGRLLDMGIINTMIDPPLNVVIDTKRIEGIAITVPLVLEAIQVDAEDKKDEIALATMNTLAMIDGNDEEDIDLSIDIGPLTGIDTGFLMGNEEAGLVLEGEDLHHPKDIEKNVEETPKRIGIGGGGGGTRLRHKKVVEEDGEGNVGRSDVAILLILQDPYQLPRTQRRVLVSSVTMNRRERIARIIFLLSKREARRPATTILSAISREGKALSLLIALGSLKK